MDEGLTPVMRREDFDKQLRRLASLRFVPQSLDGHWEALQDVPLTVLTAAVTLAQKTRSEFPTPFEIRLDADQVRRHAVPPPTDDHRTVPLEIPKDFLLKNDANEVARTIPVTREWRYYCDVCSDGGTRTFWCGGDCRQPWISSAPCERRREHSGHEWGTRCGCWDTNPALIRKREAQLKYAAERPRTRPGG